MGRVRQVKRAVREFAKEHRYNSLRKNKTNSGVRKVVAQKVKWARSYYGGKGRSAIREAIGK